MTASLEPHEIKRVKPHPVKCSKCIANLMIKPTEKVSPVCGNALPVLEKLPSTRGKSRSLKNLFNFRPKQYW